MSRSFVATILAGRDWIGAGAHTLLDLRGGDDKASP